MMMVPLGARNPSLGLSTRNFLDPLSCSDSEADEEDAYAGDIVPSGSVLDGRAGLGCIAMGSGVE